MEGLEMRAEDLMLGDYVQFFNENLEKTQYEKVTSIKIDDGTRYIQTAESDVYYREEIYKPIPLTPEILAENGLEKRSSDELVLFDNSKIDTTGEYIIIRYFVNTQRLWLCKGTGVCENEIRKNCQYVHELQHALKLCGIDKQIVL